MFATATNVSERSWHVINEVNMHVGHASRYCKRARCSVYR